MSELLFFRLSDFLSTWMTYCLLGRPIYLFIDDITFWPTCSLGDFPWMTCCHTQTYIFLLWLWQLIILSSLDDPFSVKITWLVGICLIKYMSGCCVVCSGCTSLKNLIFERALMQTCSFIRFFVSFYGRKGKIQHQRGFYWWGNSLLLVGNLEGLVGICPTSLLVKQENLFKKLILSYT